MFVSSAPSVRRRCAQRDGTLFRTGPTGIAAAVAAGATTYACDVPDVELA